MKKQLYFKKELSNEDFPGFVFMEWLYNNGLLSIKDNCKIFSHELSLSVLKQCTKDAIEKMVQEMELARAEHKCRNDGNNHDQNNSKNIDISKSECQVHGEVKENIKVCW